MKQLLSLAFAVTLVIGLTAFDTPSPNPPSDTATIASNMAVEVVNSGRDGATSGFVGGPFVGGRCDLTAVSRDGQFLVRSCQGELSNPSLAPNRAFRGDIDCFGGLTGQLIVTPSARFSFVCTQMD